MHNSNTQLVGIGSNLFKPENVDISPLWMYNLQPGNIQLGGEVSVRIKMPELYGSTRYLPADGTPVFIMAMNEHTLDIIPVGIGLLNNGVVSSAGTLSMTRLDYIGVALVNADYYERLKAVISGEVSLSQVVNEILAQ